ncbi:hypothetical protein [Tenacibaculum agarivorans]|nr:hypothetical protein [Tenacibaculum agarivorans]
MADLFVVKYPSAVGDLLTGGGVDEVEEKKRKEKLKGEKDEG